MTILASEPRLFPCSLTVVHASLSDFLDISQHGPQFLMNSPMTDEQDAIVTQPTEYRPTSKLPRAHIDVG